MTEQGLQGLQGLRVLALESRRSPEMAKLIENHGGIAISVPSMREIPAAENTAALDFAEKLLAGRFDAVIFLTGVGTRILFHAIETKCPRERVVAVLTRTLVIARGPKPVAALREFGVPIVIVVPEPNTWRDLLATFNQFQPAADLKGMSIAIQEYGVSNLALIQAFESRGATVTTVPVYQWSLPEDLAPLRRATREIAAGQVDVLLVTSATQINHLIQIAAEQNLEEEVIAGLRRTVVASIGPISTEALRAHGIAADFEPVHPRMGQLVFEAAQKSTNILRRKRGQSEPRP